MAPDFVVVAIEGGPKAVLRFKKLMLRRIDWKANIAIRSQKYLEAKKAEEADNDAADDDGELVLSYTYVTCTEQVLMFCNV
jgi:hypothetical protein